MWQTWWTVTLWLLRSLSLTESCYLINLEKYLHFIKILWFFKKMREIHLEVLNPCVKAWMKKMRENHTKCVKLDRSVALGQEYKGFLYWTRNKRNLLWLVSPSLIIVVVFCSVSLTYPSVTLWLDFTKKSLKTNPKNVTDLLLPRVSRSLLKCHVIFA